MLDPRNGNEMELSRLTEVITVCPSWLATKSFTGPGGAAAR